MRQQHSIPKCLVDIRMAIDDIEQFLGPKRDYFAYCENKMLRSAVERKLEIIGEAMNRILRTDPQFPITNARRIVDLRNRVSHGYDSVSDDNIWVIVIRDLPALKAEVDNLLG